MKYGYQSAPKVKVSAAIFPWTLAALDRLRRQKGLRSRSEAVAEALAEWAADWKKGSAVADAIARYGSRYAAAADQEKAAAERMLPVSWTHRRAR